MVPRKLAFALFLFCALNIKSQSNYDFNSYKYRVKIYQYKSVFFNSSSNNNLQGAVDRLSGNAGWEKNHSQSSTQNSLSGGYDFHRFVNTEEKQRLIFGGGNLSLNHSSSRFDNYSANRHYSVYSNLFSIGYLNLTSRNYRGNKFNIFEINSQINLNGFNNINSGPNGNRSNNGGASYSINMKYGFGKGRLELISDPIFAAFWLEDMKNKGVVNNYSTADVESLAKTITKIRNTRIIDFRFRTIDQIKMYDSFFIAQGLISKTDALYYSTVYDHYLYANNFSRYSGQRITWYGLGNTNQNLAKANLTETQKIQNSSSNYFYLQAGIGFKYENEKALNIHMQKIKRTTVELFYDFSKSQSETKVTDSTVHLYKWNSKSNKMIFYVSHFFGRGHYFNTRSYLEYGTDLGLYAVQYIKENIIFAPQVEFNLNYFYWFSPNLQLTIRSYIKSRNQIEFFDNKSSTKLSTTGNIQPGFNLSLNYTIF